MLTENDACPSPSLRLCEWVIITLWIHLNASYPFKIRNRWLKLQLMPEWWNLTNLYVRSGELGGFCDVILESCGRLWPVSLSRVLLRHRLSILWCIILKWVRWLLPNGRAVFVWVPACCNEKYETEHRSYMYIYEKLHGMWLQGCLKFCLMNMLSQIKHSTPSLRKMRSGDVQGKISSSRDIIFIIVSAKTPGNTQTDT